MIVVCFCGTQYAADGNIAQCPECGEPSALPSLTYRDMAEMACDLAEILAEHEPIERP